MNRWTSQYVTGDDKTIYGPEPFNKKETIYVPITIQIQSKNFKAGNLSLTREFPSVMEVRCS